MVRSLFESPSLGRRSRRPLTPALLLVVLATVLTACSEDSLLDLGGVSSGWIGEVATTTTTTTTTAPSTTRVVEEATWVNDTLVESDGRGEPAEVLAVVFARSDGSSSFLQASRAEIAVVVPEVRFPRILPAAASFITSQLVIESQSLTLADEPTVAFGMWSVEPYTRSRSIGQVAVLNVATDASGSAAMADGDPTCDSFADRATTLCSVESVGEGPVWRLEAESGVTHLWYRGDFRYELFARAGVAEDILRRMVETLTPLPELVEQAPE